MATRLSIHISQIPTLLEFFVVLTETTLRADRDTQVAADASSIHYDGVTMPKETDFSDCVTRTSVNTFPTSGAFV